jgi:hypothetical protein
MNLIGNAAPVVGGLVICAIAWISVRSAYRKAHAAVAAERESRSAAE